MKYQLYMQYPWDDTWYPIEGEVFWTKRGAVKRVPDLDFGDEVKMRIENTWNSRVVWSE